MISAAILGFTVYGTFDFTSMSIFEDWKYKQSIIDVVWGTILFTSTVLVYEKFISMDADLSHDPNEIPNMMNILDKSSFVIGSRYIQGGKCEMTGFRLILSVIGNKFFIVLVFCIIKCKLVCSI